MMGTRTLVKNLRKAIAEEDKYHIALYGEEACRRLLQQKLVHAKPRTIEDVLRGMVRLAEDTSNGRLDDGDIEGFANEIRELMGGGE